MQLGFIGLGRMGHNMVEHLLEKDHRVVVFDIDEKAVQSANNAGALGACTWEMATSRRQIGHFGDDRDTAKICHAARANDPCEKLPQPGSLLNHGLYGYHGWIIESGILGPRQQGRPLYAPAVLIRKRLVDSAQGIAM